MKNSFVLYGDICYSKSLKELVTQKDAYLICIEGKIKQISQELSQEFVSLPQFSFAHQLILPGCIDLHLHAPQYQYRGLGMDLELLDWLEEITFPEEQKYQEAAYAKAAYEIFANDLRYSATTRACVFSTIHKTSTKILTKVLNDTGLIGRVGKVNIDRNAPDYLVEDTKQSVEDTREWIQDASREASRFTPILTPRFVPTCSRNLLLELAKLCTEYKLPMQSHLCENLSEIAWVKELEPDTLGYADAYQKAGLFGDSIPTIMAHCVYLTEEEQQLVQEKGVYIAHCPQSNLNLSSGIAPIRTFLNKGLKVGLGTDIAGGASLSLFRAMTDAIQSSKMLWRLKEQALAPLTLEEAFYLGTMGGGSFFGKVGSFLPDYEADILVCSEEGLASTRKLTLKQRLERMIYLAETKNITHKFVAGEQLF